MRQEPVQHFIDVDGARLNVWEWQGEGDPVVLLHATGFHSRCWDYVIEELPGQHVYAVDLRFHGESSKEGEVHWPTMANDIKGLLKALDLQNVVLVGHSIGGYLATVTAADLSEHIKELVLLDPVVMSPKRYEMLDQVKGFMKPENHPVARRRTEWAGPDEMYERFNSREPFSYWQDRIIRDYCAHALNDANEDGIRFLKCSPLHEVNIYLNQNGETIHEAIPRVKAPTTIIRARKAGEGEDPFALTVSHTWSQFAESLKTGRDIHREDLTHFIPMEAPDLVVDYIKEAIKGDWHR